jgi:starvation-inducible DNA-binding protein
MFRRLHLMFEEQYTGLRDAIDGIAERIRSLGHLAAGSFTEFSGLTAIPEWDGHRKLWTWFATLPQGARPPTMRPAATTCPGTRRRESHPVPGKVRRDLPLDKLHRRNWEGIAWWWRHQ